MHRPLIVVTLAFGSGILLGRGSLFFPLSFLALLLISFLSLLAAVLLHRLPLRSFLLLLLPCLAGAGAYLFDAAWIPADHVTRLIPDNSKHHVLTGRIVSALDRDPDRTAFVLSLEKADSLPVSGRVRVSVREAVAGIGYGDRLRLAGRLMRPRSFRNPGGFDYGEFLARNGISYSIGIRNADRLEVLQRGKGLFRTVQDWRERIRQAFTASLTGQGSAILQAMVLGEEGDLTDDMRDRFAAAGVTHIISISGSHLGMLAVMCFGLMKLLMRLLPEHRYLQLTLAADPKKIAAAMTVPLVLFYTLLAGGQMATVRSFTMISAALAALLLDRESALLHALALAALLILVVSPQALFDISFQLSFLSVWTIGNVVLLWTELQLRPPHLPAKIGQNAILLLIISLSASLVTGPLAARYFNQVSAAGVLSNMFVVPFAGMVIVPLGFLSGILSLFLGHLPLAALNQFLADWFIGTVLFFSRIPFAELRVGRPGIVWLSCYAVLIPSLFVLLRAKLRAHFMPFVASTRLPRIALVLVLVSASGLAVLTVRTFLASQPAEVCFPDVGQGDSTVIRLPGNRNILIDGGGSYDDRFDVGRKVLAPYLLNTGVTSLDLVVLSHPHPDHMNGLKFILKNFDVAELWSHGLDRDLPGYEELVKIAADRHVRHRTAAVGDRAVLLGGAELRVLHPAPDFRSRERKDYSAENDRSLVLRVTLNGHAMLFPGDIGVGAERSLLRFGADPACDLIKVPHHGSRTSSSADFVRAVHPHIAVFTVGKGNPYHHPSSEVVDTYTHAGARILRTDEDGAVCVRADEGGFQETKWSDRELKRIRMGDRDAERENWERVRLRIWEL